MKERSTTSLPSAGTHTPSPDDDTVHISNVSSPMTPVVETLADDDPDHWDEGRDDLPCDTDINAVDIHFLVSSTSADVFSDEPAPLRSDHR